MYLQSLMLQSSKTENRVWARPIGSAVFDDWPSVDSSDAASGGEEGKFSMMEFAFRYFRQE